jgi:hypothetical protein
VTELEIPFSTQGSFNTLVLLLSLRVQLAIMHSHSFF